MLHPLVLLIYRIEEREIRSVIFHRQDGVALQSNPDVSGSVIQRNLSLCQWESHFNRRAHFGFGNQHITGVGEPVCCADRQPG